MFTASGSIGNGRIVNAGGRVQNSKDIYLGKAIALDVCVLQDTQYPGSLFLSRRGAALTYQPSYVEDSDVAVYRSLFSLQKPFTTQLLIQTLFPSGPRLFWLDVDAG